MGPGSGNRPFNRVQRKACCALAVACLETAKEVGDELRQRVLVNLKQIVPPRNIAEAGVLAAAGDDAVPHLTYEKCKAYPARVLAACVRTLSLIGSPAARRELLADSGYLSVEEGAVREELCRNPEVGPFRVPEALRAIRGGYMIPDFARQFASDLSPLSGVTALQTLDLGRTQVTDAALDHPAGCSKLTNLHTSGTQITKAAKKRFLASRKRV